MKLYHYTCRHAFPVIARERQLKGNPHPWLPDAGPLVHLTDLTEPDINGLGLTRNIITCDRTEYRITVVTDKAEHWPSFARRIPQDVREALESVPGALPMHWWVGAGEPIPIFTVDRTWDGRS